jgi:hypothetical protein
VPTFHQFFTRHVHVWQNATVPAHTCCHSLHSFLCKRGRGVQVAVSNALLATLAIGNGRDAAARVALSDLSAQVMDEYGNAAHCARGEARVRACSLQRLLCHID